jgi:hypothetical protein
MVDRTVGTKLRHEVLVIGTSDRDDKGTPVPGELNCERADAFAPA